MTIEEIYVNDFDSTYVVWTEQPPTPYLQDESSSYIYKSTSKRGTFKEGCWTFSSSSGLGTITSVKLRFEEKQTNLDGDASISVYVWNGSSWSLAGTIYPVSTSYAWEELNVSSILNTWAKINAAKIYLETEEATGVTSTIYIRRCTRKVDYTTEVAALASKRLLVGVGL